jgi:hypothetical protein
MEGCLQRIIGFTWLTWLSYKLRAQFPPRGGLGNGLGLSHVSHLSHESGRNNGLRVSICHA